MGSKIRLGLIDSIRGFSILSMILYHAVWIACLFGIGISFDKLFSTPFVIWERTICCAFIFISGFSFSLGKRHMRNALLLLGIGVIITAVTVIFLYDIRIIFGVLWMLGACGLTFVLIDRMLGKVFCENKRISFIMALLSLILLIFTWNINYGYLGPFPFGKITLSQNLYRGYFMTFLGFMASDFYSTDYFSYMPWVFLYGFGYYVEKLIRGSFFYEKILIKKIPFLEMLGRHSLIIYVIHPVVLFIILFGISKVM